MKGNEKIEWNSVKVGMTENEKCKQDVTLLMNKEWYKGMNNLKYISPRCIYVGM